MPPDQIPPIPAKVLQGLRSALDICTGEERTNEEQLTEDALGKLVASAARRIAAIALHYPGEESMKCLFVAAAEGIAKSAAPENAEAEKQTILLRLGIRFALGTVFQNLDEEDYVII